ncbi:hypothetical protein HAX54_021231 [Datura stramonium]|uniref:CCHC-type domain-containing protein n=1 Tax=Datura stramonium TaxID=4076 RepID=A0ABS8UUR9_DATST|nr:hypothetical protein [Datura stramonium]
MANHEEEEVAFHGDNQGNEPQKKSKSSRRDKSRGRDPSLVPISEGLTHEETEGSGTDQHDERITHAEAGMVSLNRRIEESTKAKEGARRQVSIKVDRGERDRGKSVANWGHHEKGDRNRSLQFRKDYEERKKGVNHRDGCYLCSDSSHMYRNCLKLGRLGAMTSADKQAAHARPPATTQTSGLKEQGGGAAR